jgi:chromosome segregation protein
LALRGFKSFAERTVIQFEPGITAIVGPNGSGKSNISDAVMWVLGEQSPRSLRSGSMEDVIFSGSAVKPALGMAEASLCLSNEDSTLPIEFTEVTITRRLYRSGESDYYINNSPCRLLDIHELLSDTGLGRGMYSIIGQGRLEEILSSKPEERRILIEEAGGILKHKKRKERAIRKLASMDQNLQRVKDIAQEIHRQLKPLRNQANKAQEYLVLSEKLRTLEIGLAIYELKELQEEWEEVVVAEDRLNAGLAKLRSNYAAEHASYEKLQLEFENKNFSSRDIGEKRRSLQSAEEKIHSSIRLLEEKSKNVEQRIREVKRTISQAEQRKGNLIAQRHWHKKEKVALRADLERKGAALSNLEAEVDEIQSKRKQLESTIEELRREEQSGSRAVSSHQSAVNELQLSIQTTENQLEFLRTELEALVKKKHGSLQRAEEKKNEVERIDTELADFENQLNELTVLIERLSAEYKEKRSEVGRLQQELAGTRARVKALEDIVNSFPTIKDIAVSLGVTDMPDMVGLVKDAIRVRPEYEKAIGAVLGGDIFCVVVEKTESLKNLILSKRNEPVGITSFISNDRVKYDLQDMRLPFGTSALDVVSYPKEFKHVVQMLLGNVYIVTDLDAALSLQEELKNEVLVTVDGEIIFPNGKVVLGAVSETVGILGYQRELRELRDCITENENTIMEIEEVKAEIDHRLEELNIQENGVLVKVQAMKVEQSRLKQSLADVDHERSRLVNQEERMHYKIHELEQKLRDDGERILGIKQEAKVHNDKLRHIRSALDDAVNSKYPITKR